MRIGMKSKKSFNPVSAFKKKAQFYVDKWRAFIQMSSQFFPHVRKESNRVILSLIAGLGYIIVGMLEPWPLKLIFDNVFLNDPLPQNFQPLVYYTESKTNLLYSLISIIVAIAITRGVFYYFQRLLISRSGQKIVSGIRVDLYNHLQRLSFSFHDRRKTGDMLARLTTDIRILKDNLLPLPLRFITELFLMTAMVIVMAFMDLQLTLIALMVIPMIMILVKRYRFPMKQAMRKQREKEGHLTSIASETLGSIKVVKGFSQEAFEVSKFNSKNKNSLKSGMKAARLEARLKWASELSVAIITALILGVAGRRVLMGALSPGDLLVFAYYLKAFNRPLRRISKMTEQLSRTTASGDRIVDMIKVEPEIIEKSPSKIAPPFRGEICYKNVCFEYKSGNPILLDVNLTISPGERVALVGHSGSGKSTLASLLPRFYDCTSGLISIDGVNIKDWSLQSLRKQISVIFQEPILFASTIAENIAYGKPGVSRNEIIDAAKRAHIHQIIDALPKSYDTVIGERGMTLSGGQRQCIAIARAIIKNAPIIIFDEPTSGLDLPSAMLVMRAIKELMEDKTAIIISHQQETIHDVDRVIKMSRKRIIANKTPDQFWCKENRKKILVH